MLGSRRRRPPNPPLTAMTANPNAAMAAAAVFNRQQQSLSSAAAATALRARPATPTNVAEVQTKRTMRRSASMSSSGTAPDVSGRPSSALQRRGSSSSMAEKTFRTPSPHRPATAGATTGSTSSPGFGRASQEAPPVPALPENIDPRGDSTTNGNARQRQPQHRKSNSLGMGPTPVRVASQRLGKEGTPSWFGAAQVGDMKNVRTSDAAMTTTSKTFAQEQDDGRPSSRASSINFSYPARARVGSPPASPIEGRAPELPSPTSDAQNKRTSSRSSSIRNRPVSAGSVQSLVYDPNSRRMVPRYEPVQEDSGVRPTTEKASRKQKGKSQHTQGAAGRAQAAPTEPGPGVRSQQTPAPTRNQPTTAPVSTQEPDYYQEEPDVKAIISSPRLDAKRIGQQRAQETHAESNSSEADGNAISLPSDTVQARQPIRRKPSVVREESEPEDSGSGPTTQHSVTDALDSVPTRQRIYAAAKQPTTSAEAPSRSSLKSPPPPPQQPIELPGEAVAAQEVATARQDKSVVFESRATSDIRSDRTHSSSPARTAHFGSVQDSPDIRHSPPPRSVSPRKPALKQRSPSRELSPDDNTSETSSSLHPGEELAVPRKKAVRVSFNDADNVLVGESSSSHQAEPPSNAAPSQTNAARRPWYSSIARGKKKDVVSLEDDEVMKPRPALPSFGSVRDKKLRESSPGEEERPLVRPYELRSEASSTGASADSAIGELLLRQQQEAEQVSRNAANISRFREPLPPVVTSVDGGGYMSDTSSESEQEGATSPVTETSTAAGEGPEAIVDTPRAVAEEVPFNGSALPAESVEDSRATMSEPDSDTETDIPAITISQPTPPPPKTPPQQAFFDVPGGFPEDESETSAAEVDKKPAGSSSVEPAREVVLEPVVQPADTKSTLPASQTPATVLATSLAADEDTDTSDSGIYSDAYEDLSDIEDGGFMSLDAVVESPIGRNSSNRPLGQDEPKQKELVEPTNREVQPSNPLPAKLVPDLSSASTVVESQVAEGPEDDWERAKMFWRSLTADKRAQLEREAREDAGAEGDLDGSPKPAQKMKKKKSVDRRNSERKALAVHLAQQMMAKQQDQRQRTDHVEDHDRNYMIKPGTKVGDDGFTRVPDDVPPMRKTMRNDGSILKSSTRDGRGTTDGKAPTTRVTSGSQGTRGHVRQTSEVSSSTAGTKSSFIPNPLRRHGSGSSESSFKRSSPMGQSGGFAFRKTMRQSSPASNERTPSKRFSLRSLSPAGGFSRASPPTGASGMRHTLRGPPAQENRPSTASRIANFGRGSAAKGARGSKKSSSRFGDSSDEDAPAGSRFRSRFDDSSDEDDVTPRAAPRPVSMPVLKSGRSSRGELTATRGFQPAAEASPALPEEEEEDEEEPPVLGDPEKEVGLQTPKARVVDDGGLRRSRSGRGGLIGSPTSPDMSTPGAFGAGGGSRSKKRNSLMSVLRRKKHGAGAIQRAEVMDSAARRDTPLERGAHQLKGMRRLDDDQEEQDDQPTPLSQHQQQPRSPRLQKRTVSLTHDAGAGWLFPGREAEAERSGNLGTRTMSGSSTVVVAPRQMTSASLTSIGEGKKKRFGALRRVFRLPE